ncbi:hypothetical protein SAMN04487949_1249 [Halogranum gelatinilyticum]|uniref:Uncharacterized protein n=1 Tax=Halogranum gelatinilyticum TaxID=660521 RepID=A0A1G9R9V5_9EURY|nr:hypothetical protein [Halogranum gelatinilyticum]SDM20023.1 hypothetical protein SAMN04487949_1249 [Halogranum gelatinilyticum]
MVSVSAKQQRYAVVGLALLLVFNPFYLDGVLHFDDPNRYEYHAAAVEFRDDGTPDLPLDLYGRSLDDEMACFLTEDRGCALEQHVLDHGGSIPTDEDRPYATYDYVYVDGAFYSVEYTGTDDGARMHLNETTRETALGVVSEPLAFASDGAQEVVRDGPVTRRTAIPDAYQLLVDDGNYYVVYAEEGRFYGEDSFERRRGTGTAIETAISAVGVLVGLGLWTVVTGRR